MNNQIIFTPGDVIEIMKSVCYLITLVAAVVGIIVAAVSRMKAPGKAQDQRLDNHETRIGNLENNSGLYEEHLRKLDALFSRLESDNKVYQRGMLALVNHARNGNNFDELDDCGDELTKVIYRTDDV